MNSSEDSDSETELSVGPFLRSYVTHIPNVPLPIKPVDLVEPTDQAIVVDDDYDNDLHVEDSPVTMRQSGRVCQKPAWISPWSDPDEWLLP